MLQRAASNAYSWWWASHIRTKQSKWLEHNLQGMEEKVKYTLKIINEDGDTFSQRADMYYRKRPEIVNFVEEAFRSYRALAERYDHLSTEFQSANHMIATAFPEHVHFDDDDDDDEDNENTTKPKNLHLITCGTNIPEIPEIPKKEFKSQSLMFKKKKEPADMKRSSALVSSGFSKEEAMKEIDKIHKEILVLQTEKEFVRSSYENSYEMYWNLENEVTEMQKRVCSLQDEFGFGEEIEDGEARRLVAITALRSCKDMIAKLEETQKRFDEEAEIEKKRIDSATRRFETLRNKFEIKVEEGQDSREIELNENLSNVEFSEKIDELVEKVVSLETASSSYTALVKTLRSETDELHEHLSGLEEAKASMTLKDEMSRVRNLFQRVEDQKKYLQKHLTEAKSRAESLSRKIQDMKMDEDAQEEDHSDDSDSITKETEIKSVEEDHSDDSDSITKDTEIKSVEEIELEHSRDQDSVQEEKPETQDSCDGLSETESSCFSTEAKDQLLPANGMEDKDNVILDEYKSVLRDYREMKRKLSYVERKNRDGFFELALQLRELKNAVSSEYVSISHSSNSSISMAPYQQEGDLKRTSERTKEDEVKVKSADIDDNLMKITTAEKKVRGDIDAVLEENIEFWLRFSTSIHQIQKYQTAVHDLKSELSKLRIASETKPICRHLRDIQTELQLWLENSSVLREELEGRYTTLCNIKDEISRLTSQSYGTKVSDTEINSYQAAKFHGEILNMKQENKRVFNELQAGLDRARGLRSEVERVVSKIEEEIGMLNVTTTRSLGKSMLKPKIPLRSFLFGVKLKKYKQQKKETRSVLQKQCSYIVSP